MSIFNIYFDSVEEPFITIENFTGFDGKFLSRSLLRVPPNLIEELIYHILDSMANFDLDFACFSC